MEVSERRVWSPARQCTATNSQGERCRRQPIPGGVVCVNHGGKAPQTVAAARLRLLAGRDLAIDALIRALESHGPRCETCGRSDDDRDPVAVNAARIVLDRTGLGPSANITITPAATPADWVRWMTRDEVEMLNNLFDEVKQRHYAGEPPPEHGLQLNDTLGNGITAIRQIIIDVPGTMPDSLPPGDGTYIEVEAPRPADVRNPSGIPTLDSGVDKVKP